MGIASSAIKGITGIAQMLKRKPDEIEYNMPVEVLQSMEMSRQRAQGTNAAFGTRKENLESQTAAMARRATEMGGPAAMGSLSKLQANQMAGTRDIDMAEEQYQLQQEQMYQQELQNVAKFKDREFELNELQPNERQWNEFYNSKKAGSKNLMGAMDSIVGLAGSVAGQNGIDAELEKTLGGGAPQGQTVIEDQYDWDYDLGSEYDSLGEGEMTGLPYDSRELDLSSMVGGVGTGPYR